MGLGLPEPAKAVPSAKEQLQPEVLSMVVLSLVGLSSATAVRQSAARAARLQATWVVLLVALAFQAAMREQVEGLSQSLMARSRKAVVGVQWA